MDASASTPLVTVLVPTIGGRADLLRAAVASVLAQDYPALDVLVSDNESPEGVTAALSGIDDPRLRVVRRAQRLGMAQHWDACLADVHGAYLLALSDDDQLAAGAVSALASVLTKSGVQARVAYGPCRVVDERGRVLWTTPAGPALESADDFVLAYLAHRRVLYPCATLMHVDTLRAAGGYRDDGFGPAFDVAAFLRVAYMANQVAAVAAPVADYAEHLQNFTRTRPFEAWVANFHALGRLLASLAQPQRQPVIAKRLHTYVAYFVLDLAMKSHYGRVRGVWSALREAIRAQTAHAPPLAPRAVARIVAKIVYLGVFAPRRR